MATEFLFQKMAELLKLRFYFPYFLFSASHAGFFFLSFFLMFASNII